MDFFGSRVGSQSRCIRLSAPSEGFGGAKTRTGATPRWKQLKSDFIANKSGPSLNVTYAWTLARSWWRISLLYFFEYSRFVSNLAMDFNMCYCRERGPEH